MRARALIFGLVTVCLVSLLAALWQHDLVEELRRDVQREATRHASRTSQLKEAVLKNVELSERITRLSEESARSAAAAIAAEKARKELQGTLEKRGHVAKAVEERLKAIEKAVGELSGAIQNERDVLDSRLGDGLEPLQTALKELRKEIADLRAANAKTAEDVAAQATSLSAKIDELTVIARKGETPESERNRVLDEIAQVSARLAEQKQSLENLNRKIEIVGRMLAVDGREFETGAEPPPPVEATVDAVDSARGEVALRGDLQGLKPGHTVWIAREGNAVARTEVFRVDDAGRLAAARITWSRSGDFPRVGDTATTSRPAGAAEGPVGEARKPTASEGRAEESGGAKSTVGNGAAPSVEGPISHDGTPLEQQLERDRPPPPPPRPERDG